MSINIGPPEVEELKPKIAVIGVGGAGGNAIANMIAAQVEGVDFIVTNTDAQSLNSSTAERRIQLGPDITQGLGAGSRPEVGRAAAEETIDLVEQALDGTHMCFIAAGMGGGTGTGAAPVIAKAARDRGILTVGVVTKPFTFEGTRRMKAAEAGIEELQKNVDTLIVIPNQNLFLVANPNTTFKEAFLLADEVLQQGVRGITDLMVMPGLINLDFADIRTVMSEMGKAMMGTGEASGEKRAIDAAEAAINNPLLEDASMKGAKGVLINITGGFDMTLFEVDEAANRIREEVDSDANIIFGSTFDEKMEGVMRVSVVATGIAAEGQVAKPRPQLSVVTPRPVKQPEPEPMPETAIRAEAAPMAAAPKPAASMSTLDITRQAESGIGELSFPDADDYAEVASLDSAEDDQEETGIEKVEIVDAAAPAVAKVAPDAFRPTASTVPQRRPDMTPKAADPFRGSDMVNATRAEAADAAPKSRSAGLFRQITGLGLKNDKPAEAPAPQPQQAQRPAPAQAAQPRLGALNPGDRVRASQNEDEMLDIPAFLRRQAN